MLGVELPGMRSSDNGASLGWAHVAFNTTKLAERSLTVGREDEEKRGERKKAEVVRSNSPNGELWWVERK